MAVAFVMRWAGGTLDQYDQVLDLMGFEDNRVDADGAVFHWVTATDDGLLVTDVWESDEAFQRFADEQIGPLTAQVGLGEPDITRHEIHNWLVAEKLASAASA
jgi:hypothetical protein